MTIPNKPELDFSLPIFETPERFQNIVNSYSERLRRNATLDAYSDLNEIKERPAALKVSETEFYTPAIYLEDEREVYLASVSKIAITLLAQELFSGQEFIELSGDQLVEIVEEILKRTKSQINNKIEGQTPLDFASSLSTIGQYLNGDINDTNKVSIQDLIELTLVISTNSTTTVLKELCAEKITPGGSLDAKRNNLYREMKSRLPGYNINTDSTNNYMWLQGNANTGKLSEFVRLQRNISANDPELAGKMSNNPIDFRFDFTHSELGKKLIESGAQIIEKTGSYEDGVNWGRNLLERGLPFHAPLLTVVTILKDGKEFSFGYYKAYELPFPSDQVEEYEEEMEFADGPATIKFPNVYSTEFLKSYVPQFEETAYDDFRNSMLSEVTPFIERIFGIK